MTIDVVEDNGSIIFFYSADQMWSLFFLPFVIVIDEKRINIGLNQW
jgi:hypothetical protein